MAMVTDTPRDRGIQRTPPTVTKSEGRAKSADPSQVPAIHVEGLNFYYGAKKALENVTLSIQRNQVTALMARRAAARAPSSAR